MQHHTIWTPHDITHVEASEDEPRKGFIGRAVALYDAQGIEYVLMTRNEVDLAKMAKKLLVDNFDPKTIYKATLIHSSGIEIVVPPEPEVPAAPDLHPEVSPAPAGPGAIPVRTDDGVPVVTYAKDTPMISDAKVALEEEDDEL